jgi:HTH-type transcriptional regulator / antitoxin HigA
MKYQVIKSEEQYEKALERLDEIFDTESSSIEGQEAELLALLIEDYENQIYPIDTPDPIVAIKIRMEELSVKQKDLVGVVGAKGIVSEVLNKKRKLTVTMIRNLSAKLKIAPNVLIQDYALRE